MPYTPPSQRSPANSNPNSPILSRNHSYETDTAPSEQNPRPGLPRSRSATYLQKHRRTPSLADQQPAYDGPRSVSQQHHHHHHHHTHRHHGHSGEEKSHTANDHSHRAQLSITTEGSTASPSDSTGSEEEEEPGRGRQLQDLADTLRESMIVPKRPHSPNRTEDDAQPAAPIATPTVHVSTTPALTPEARKISHSRSSSEIHLSTHLAQASGSSSPRSSEGSDDDDDDLHIKPPLLRKKSGELVKPALRPSSNRRPSSMPGTPTYAKNVHFNEDIEQVRHFLQVDRPIAVSAGSSPVETYDSESEYPFGNEDGHKSKLVEWEIRLANFPRDTTDRLALPVRVEKIWLSSDFKTLLGTIAVVNIAYHKLVVARFTFDYWKTTSEVVAEYNNDMRKKLANDGYDRFSFNIKLSDQAHLESKTLLLCARYNVNGQEFWDNNDSTNYQVDFIKKIAPRKPKVVVQGVSSAGSLGNIPRSRQSPTTLVRPRSFPAGADDDFTQSFEFASGDSILRERPNPNFRMRSGRRGTVLPDQARQKHGGQHFANRYDFGASLTAALTNAQQAMGDRSGITMKESKPVNASKLPPAAPPVQPVEGPRPDMISSERPDLHSAEYNDLIQKFCYVGRTSPGLA